MPIVVFHFRVTFFIALKLKLVALKFELRHCRFFLKKWANPGVFFFIFVFSIQKNVQFKFLRWLDSNSGPLELEATALPTEPHPLPSNFCYLTFTLSQWQVCFVRSNLFTLLLHSVGNGLTCGSWKNMFAATSNLNKETSVIKSMAAKLKWGCGFESRPLSDHAKTDRSLVSTGGLNFEKSLNLPLANGTTNFISL